MKTDTELFKEYFALLGDEREVLERKIKLFEEMSSSSGVFKDFGQNIDELKESLFKIRALQIFYKIFCDGAETDEAKIFMESDEFKKYANKPWEDRN